MDLWRGKKINTPFDAADLPVILILKISPITPPVDLYSQSIFSFADILCDVELCRCLASLAVAYFFPVHPDIHRRFDTAKMEKHLTVCPRIRDGKKSPVRSHWIIFVGNMRGVCRKRVIRICIDGHTESLQFPISRYIDVRPMVNLVFFFKKAFRPL